MIKLCGKSIFTNWNWFLKPPYPVGNPPIIGKKTNAIPAHKNLVKNYKPISLFPIFGKNL